MVEEMPVLVCVLVRNGWGNACVSVCVCVLVRNGWGNAYVSEHPFMYSNIYVKSFIATLIIWYTHLCITASM